MSDPTPTPAETRRLAIQMTVVVDLPADATEEQREGTVRAIEDEVRARLLLRGAPTVLVDDHWLEEHTNA